MALDALRHYAGLDGPFRGYTELRNNIVDNMAKEYMRTGFIWEHYDDVDGQGGGQSPFTGWSALVVNIMAEIYWLIIDMIYWLLDKSIVKFVPAINLLSYNIVLQKIQA